MKEDTLFTGGKKDVKNGDSHQSARKSSNKSRKLYH